MSVEIRHARVALALHQLREGEVGCTPLLLLHELRASSAGWGASFEAWPGAVWGLDFCGHGASSWLKSGVYYPEMLAGDADAALAHIGDRAVVAGAGVGAYVTLLLAGSRAKAVEAAILAPGVGLAGCGDDPDFDNLIPELPAAGSRSSHAFDPRVANLEQDPRPADYARSFAASAQRLVLVEDGSPRPTWWRSCAEPGAETVRGSLADGLELLAP